MGNYEFQYYLVRPLPIIKFDLNFFYLFKDILMISPATTGCLVLVVFNSYLSMLDCRSFHSYSFPSSLVLLILKNHHSTEANTVMLTASSPNLF